SAGSSPSKVKRSAKREPRVPQPPSEMANTVNHNGWWILFKRIRAHSVQLGYTVHSRPFILNVWNTGGFWQLGHPGFGKQGFQPSGKLIHVSSWEGSSSGLIAKSRRTVLPASSLSKR